jgi:hypothetical protein
MFYPADRQQLHNDVSQYINDALGLQTGLQTDLQTASRADDVVPKAIIAPHAGYIYSGPVAASAYARLLPARDRIHRVILLGPSHRVPFRGLAISSADTFATPLGEIKIDQEATALIADLPQVHLLDEAHAQEHSLEVHLPFLLEVLDDFLLMPLVVGEAHPAEVAEVLERLWGGPETLIVISSDLSHYHDYATAQQLDKATSEAIESLQLESIHSEDACGCVPVSGLLHLARKRGLHASTVDLRNSFDTTGGDTASSKARVVGYGAYVFNE